MTRNRDRTHRLYNILPSFNGEIAIKYRLVGKNVNIIGLPLLEQRKSEKEGDKTKPHQKKRQNRRKLSLLEKDDFSALVRTYVNRIC